MQQLQTGPAEKLLHVRRGGLRTTKRPGRYGEKEVEMLGVQ